MTPENPSVTDPFPSHLVARRATYIGQDDDPNYEALNPWVRDQALLPRLLQSQSENAMLTATPAYLEALVKVIKLPLEFERSESEAAADDMRRLQRANRLVQMGSGRKTDLFRGRRYDENQNAELRTPDLLAEFDCGGLSAIIAKIESILAGTGLFVRSVRMDDARFSSTAKGNDILAPNIHFDAGRVTDAETSGTLFQCFVNLGQLPRQFRVIPVTRRSLVDALTNSGLADVSEGWMSRQPTKLLDTILNYWPNLPLEIITVPSASMAVFDGRTFPHDGGKMHHEALIRGEQLPAEELDVTLQLERSDNFANVVYYDVTESFLDDRGKP